MNGKRIVHLALLAAMLAVPLLLVQVPSAMADVTQISKPISFTLSGCAALPAGVTVQGSGESFAVVNSRVDSSTGVTYVEQNDIVTGTATDSTGANYNFNYHNHASLQIPPAGFPFSFETTDHFNLVGNGQANQYQVHFVARVTFFSPTSFTADFINVHGSPFTCDPI